MLLCFEDKGRRLRPITENIPKPLIEINDKPILEYLLNHLAAEGVNNVTLATGYKSELIDDFIRGYRGKSVIMPIDNF
jgi:MurNAc alpha-1-phosphate uridylyltransferase